MASLARKCVIPALRAGALQFRQFPAKTLPQSIAILSVQKRHLPICTVDTNVKKTDIPVNFSAQLTKFIAEMLGKPAKLISTVLHSEVDMCRDLQDTPTCVVHIWSIGVFDSQRNGGYSLQTVSFIHEKLGIPEDRIAIIYHPIEREQAGHLLYADLKPHTDGKS